MSVPIVGIFMPTPGMKPTIRPKVGPPKRRASVADALFTSTQQRVLSLLFGQPSRSYYATELIGLAGVGSGAVQRELARLVGSGLVTVRPIGNQKHYQADPNSPLFHDLCSIAQKAMRLAEPRRDARAETSPRE
jgi:predicted transcriptional regulator